MIHMGEQSVLTEKQCSKCGRMLSVSLFHKDSKSVDGHVRRCKECVASGSKQRYSANRDDIRAKCRDRYSDNRASISERRSKRWRESPEIRAHALEYNRTHRHITRGGCKKWRQKNAQYDNDRKRAWEKEHPESRRLVLARYRALLKSLRICEIKRSDLLLRISVFGDKCAHCGAPWEHLDHVKPISRRGPHCLANLRPACAPCNHRKSGGDAMKWLATVPKAKPLPLLGFCADCGEPGDVGDCSICGGNVS